MNTTLQKVLHFFSERKPLHEIEQFAKTEYRTDWQWVICFYERTGKLPTTGEQP